MASKFFLRRTAEAVGISPTPDSGWEDVTSIARCLLRLVTSGDSHADVTITETSSTDKDCLARQYVAPLKAGQTITGAQAVQFVCRFQESTSNNNMNSVFGIRVIAADGVTVQKTVLAVTREANEMVASPTALTNRNNTATSAATNYTTVAGDYLVIEIGAGGDPAGSSAHTFALNLGDNTGTFLAADDTATAANDPWVQLADTLILEYSLVGAFISSGNTVSAPSLPVNVAGGFISSGATALAPSVQYVISMPTIASGNQEYAQTVAIADQPQGKTLLPILGSFAFFDDELRVVIDSVAAAPGTLSLSTISAGATANAPTLAYAVSLPSISSTAALYAQALAYALSLPTIASGAAALSPALAYAMGLPIIGSTLTVPSPTLAYAMSLPIIGATASVFSPALAYAVTVPFIASGNVVSAPALAVADSVSLPTISAAGAVFSPTLTYNVASPTIASTFAAGAPSLGVTVSMPAISSTLQVYSGALAYAMSLPAISSTVSVLAPTLGYAVSLPTIGTTLTVPAPTMPSAPGFSAIRIDRSTSTLRRSHQLSTSLTASESSIALAREDRRAFVGNSEQ